MKKREIEHASALQAKLKLQDISHIETTYLSRYRFADRAKPASKSELEAFRTGHSILAVWPYLREFVQSITAKMGFPTVPLPLLRLVPSEKG